MWSDLTLWVAQGKPWTQRLGGAQSSSSLRAGNNSCWASPLKRCPWKVRDKFSKGNTFAKGIHTFEMGNVKTEILFSLLLLSLLQQIITYGLQSWTVFPQIFNSSVSPKVGDYRSKWNPLFDPKVFREPSSPTHWAAGPVGNLQCEPHLNESGNGQLEFRLWNIWCGQLPAWSL